MSVDYKDNGRAIFAYQNEKHVATIVRQGEKFGYNVFGTPHRDVVNSEDEARNAVESGLD